MTIDDLIRQLDGLRDHCADMERGHKDEPDNIWEKDTKALTAVIEIIKAYRATTGVDFIAPQEKKGE